MRYAAQYFMLMLTLGSMAVVTIVLTIWEI